MKKIREDAVAVNNIGSGNIEGTGVGIRGEPGVPKRKKKLRSIIFRRFTKGAGR